MSDPASPAGAEQREEQRGVHYDTRLPEYSRWRRMQIPVIAGYFLYAEQLNPRMLGGVALVVAGTLLLRLP